MRLPKHERITSRPGPRSRCRAVEFRVSNLPEAQTIELPGDLLESDVAEGPPGANPDLVGEGFLLVYDDQDQLIRVEHG